MICDHCHERPATIVISNNVDDKTEKVYLCEICASENEAYIAQNNPFQQFMGAVFEQKSTPTEKTIQCPNCGMSIEEFKKNSKIGCYTCYHTFDGYLNSIFKQIHGNTRHSGKRPGNLDKKIRLINEINSMQIELKQALAIEDYEQAAKLRDAIKAMRLKGAQNELQ